MFGLNHLLALRRDPLQFYADLQRDQGDCASVRLGPYRMHVLFAPREIEAVLTSGSGSLVRLERVMSVLAQWNGRSLLILEGDEWRQRRRRVLGVFARRRLARVGAISARYARALAGAWRQGADAHGTIVIDMDRAMADLALRIGLDAMFGRQAKDTSHLSGVVADLSHIAYRESAGLWRTPMWMPFGDGRLKRRACTVLDSFVREAIAERQGRSGPGDDLLSVLLEENDLEAVRDDAITLLIAGHETTGAALCWLVHLLAEHPAALRRVQDEIAALDPGGRDPTPADLDRLPYLKACIDETLRLFPPAYGLFPRRAVAPVTLGRVEVRQGDIIQVVPFVTQRDARWFPDPLAFDPSRFLGQAQWPGYAYIPFGAGPRVCIGQNFGVLEMMTVAAVLLAQVSPERTGLPAHPRAAFSLRPSGGLPLSLRLGRAGA